MTRIVSCALLALGLWLVPLRPSAAQRAPHSSQENLLVGKPIVSARAVANPSRMADGYSVAAGDFWLTDRSARLRGAHAEVIWDLGYTALIRCAFLQGDNNDFFRIAGSLNGDKWFPLWQAPPVRPGGMQIRHSKLVGNARYIRLKAHGGDRMYGVSELGLYSTCPEAWPPTPDDIVGKNNILATRTGLWWFALAGILFVFLQWRGQRWWGYFVALLPLSLGVRSALDLWPFFPLFEVYTGDEITYENTLRAVVAAVALAVAIKEGFFKERWRMPPAVRNATLGVLALISVGCYYHFTAPQFHHAADDRPTHVHTFDLRHYVPIAKYYDELKFDGLYAASLAAFMDITERNINQVGGVTFRDLRTSEVKRAYEMRDHIKEVRARFSDDRWRSFVTDMKELLHIMGDGDYLVSMGDHGGNATPVWILSAYTLLHDMRFNEANLVAVGLLDPALLLVLFAAVWWAFGFRVCAFAMILFGATDFYMLGSNLMGSILRQDWLVALGLAACFFKKKHPLVGGGLLAYAGLIRAFPALSTFYLAAPIVWALLDRWVFKTKGTLKDVLGRGQKSAWRAIAGAFICVVLMVGATSAVFGPGDSWGKWFEKISMHASDPSVNSVGLRNIMAYRSETRSEVVLRPDNPEPWVEWQDHFHKNLEDRKVAYYGVMVLALAIIFLAMRGLKLYQLTLLGGLCSVPFVFYLSNYYIHFIFLFPLAAHGITRASALGNPTDRANRYLCWTVGVLSLLCLGQYATLSDTWYDTRFTKQSALLLCAFMAIVLPLAITTVKEMVSRKAVTLPGENETSERGI